MDRKSLDHGDVYKGGRHRLFVGAKWEEMGKLQFDYLLSRGLKPEHVFIDVACGALRAGTRLIPYLDVGNYLGLEAEKILLQEGIDKELGPHLQASKQPEFVVSRTFEFERFRKKPDYGIAQSLFTHLNGHDIDLCLGNLKPRAKPGMKFFVTFFEGDRSANNPKLSHAQGYFEYTRDEMARFGEDAGFSGEYIGDRGHPKNQKMFLYKA